MSKPSDTTTTPATATSTLPLITKNAVEAAMLEIALALEIPKEECKSEHYGFLIMGALQRLGISGLPPAEFLTYSMQAWNYIPKNPSAMRQFLNREDKGDSISKGASALLAKLLPTPPTA